MTFTVRLTIIYLTLRLKLFRSGFYPKIDMDIKKTLSYEDFGAIGDGINNDFDAIIACHEEANRTGTPVKTKDGATYYIGGENKSAIINTDVDFGKSKFIIDDRKLEKITSYVFIIASPNPEYEIKIDSLSKNDKYLDIPHEGDLYVRVFDENKNIFIRKGLNVNAGTAKTDCFILRDDGSIYPSLDWDYENVTHAVARSCNELPITVKGGIFTTIANEEESFYRYHQRGILIKRAHVVVEGFEHYVENEKDHGAPYHGFIRSEMSYDVIVRNAIVTPRFTYYTVSRGDPNKLVPMGSYDLSFWSSIDVKCENIKQTIDITNSKYWGVYTSNFCKNLCIENCIFSRFDAHQGVTNAYIKNCTLGHQYIRLIGHGEFVIEDSKIINDKRSFLSLREDYGSLWDGNITIKNCEWHSTKQQENYSIISQGNEGDHDYGYTCIMARDVVIDGFTLYNGADTPAEQTNFAALDDCQGANPTLPYPYVTPKTLTMANVNAENGAECVPTYAPQNHKDLVVNFK